VRDTPIGDLTVWVVSGGVLRIEFGAPAKVILGDKQLEKIFNQAARELHEYFAGKRRVFEVPIEWGQFRGTREKVLRATFAIPYGEVMSYGELAAQVGMPGGARAVGRIMATNPIPIIIPCHRVIGSDRALHGYAGHQGIQTKAWLLQLEGRHIVNQRVA